MSEHAVAVGNTFVWHELYTRDVDASLKFYQDVLGWGTTSMPMGEMGDYHMLIANGQPVAGVFKMEGPGFEEVPPHWSVYTSVDDVDARVAKAVEAGATIMVPAMDVPTVGRMCLIKDPQGATIWFYKSATPEA